jgi:hypothetical protein
LLPLIAGTTMAIEPALIDVTSTIVERRPLFVVENGTADDGNLISLTRLPGILAISTLHRKLRDAGWGPINWCFS